MKFISINIEGSKHLDLVLLFLEKEQPDVLCVQEIFESDIPLFKSRLGMDVVYAPLCRWDARGTKSAPEVFGTALFTRGTLRNPTIVYYIGSPKPLLLHVATKPETLCHAFVSGEFVKGDQIFPVGTTHFVWTPDGQPSERQRKALDGLLKALEARPEIIFSGDFNAPRGGEIFSAIAARYKDNIPPEYKTSIDGNIHRAGPLPYMVDGLFTTPGYIAEDVKLVDGVSDHMAVVANIRTFVDDLTSSPSGT